MKNRTALFAVLLSVSMLSSACGTAAAAQRTAADSAAVQTAAESPAAADATTVIFNGTEAKINGSGAEFSDGVLKIVSGGSYTLSGTLEGQVLVETGKEDEVRLFLNGVQITSGGAYAIASVKGALLTVTMMPGTTNTLTVTGAETEAQDGQELTEEQEADAAVYVKNDLVLNGEGTLEIDSSLKGVHAKDTLTVEKGEYVIHSADDAFNGKDAVTVNGGSFSMVIADTSEGKGITSKGDVLLNDGSMVIEACSEGIEGLTVAVNGGSWSITSEDDGINAREKYEGDDEREKEMLSQQNNEKVRMIFNGGTVTVNSKGDGLDSNGSIEMNGGAVYVSGSADNGNAAVDMNGEALVNGGILLTAGAQGMTEPLSDSSAQNIITVYYEAQLPAGTAVTVTNAGGEELVSWTVPKAFNMLQISAEGIQDGDTVTVKTGGEEKKITVTGINTYEGTRSGGFGGHGGMGGFGGQRPEGFGGRGMRGERPEGFEGMDGQRPEGMTP
ncbi:MAG: carbohydrate-binding domain-containing protein [Stomatobaculum sp.]|nr:carbohydrate-binding domain-containing protein [Stomatobaculum sp.]